MTLHRLDIRIDIIKNMHTYVFNQYNILRVLCKVFATHIYGIKQKFAKHHITMTFVPGIIQHGASHLENSHHQASVTLYDSSSTALQVLLWRHFELFSAKS